MICKTRGIVLRTTDYSDTSLITRIYTEQFGIQNYLIKGAKRKNSSARANLFQPLACLELVVYKKERQKLHTLKEARPEIHFSKIQGDPARSSVLFFINDILLKCLHEEENNPELFSFLHETIHMLDLPDSKFSNLHLLFLVRFSRFLGFYPQGTFSHERPIFDLQEGKFIKQEPRHNDYLTQETSQLFNQLLLNNYYSLDAVRLKGMERKSLLDILLRYYELHLTHMGTIASHKVLEQVFA